MKASDILCGFEENVSPNEHADNGASTPEATPRLCAAEAGGAAAFKKCVRAVCAAKLRPSFQLTEGSSPRLIPFLCANEAANIYSARLLNYRVIFCCCGSVGSPQAQT
jgi:hypothetical protein